jgi:hypothetical protein
VIVISSISRQACSKSTEAVVVTKRLKLDFATLPAAVPDQAKEEGNGGGDADQEEEQDGHRAGDGASLHGGGRRRTDGAR